VERWTYGCKKKTGKETKKKTKGPKKRGICNGDQFSLIKFEWDQGKKGEKGDSALKEEGGGNFYTGFTVR